MKQQGLFEAGCNIESLPLNDKLKDELKIAADVIRPDMSDGELIYIPEFIEHESATALLRQLQESLKWRQDDITLYGRTFKIPRLQAWYGEPEALHSYSGIDMTPLPWTNELLGLKEKCERYLQCEFNSVLANWYRDGQDSMGMHCDNEPELGNRPVIAALSLGQERVLKFKHKSKPERFDVPMQNGSLLVMAGSTQHYWLHGINKSRRAMSDRISLTFRRIYPNLKL